MELAGLDAAHDACAPELQIQWQEHGLEERQDGRKYDKPHLDQMRDEALVGYVAESLVERAEACVEQFV
ncbi:hypothetical protein N0V95_010113 [Ascochyta clinopodiicola]|nr:hypothetical protein N0V95_010113 [Ascochyta clinopodiicola]